MTPDRNSINVQEGLLLEDVIERLTQGNVSAVKSVLASVVTALAFYQVFMAALQQLTPAA